MYHWQFKQTLESCSVFKGSGYSENESERESQGERENQALSVVQNYASVSVLNDCALKVPHVLLKHFPLARPGI